MDSEVKKELERLQTSLQDIEDAATQLQEAKAFSQEVAQQYKELSAKLQEALRLLPEETATELRQQGQAFTNETDPLLKNLQSSSEKLGNNVKRLEAMPSRLESLAQNQMDSALSKLESQSETFQQDWSSFRDAAKNAHDHQQVELKTLTEEAKRLVDYLNSGEFQKQLDELRQVHEQQSEQIVQGQQVLQQTLIQRLETIHENQNQQQNDNEKRYKQISVLLYVSIFLSLASLIVSLIGLL